MDLESFQLPIASTLAVGGALIIWQSIHPRGRLWGPIHYRGDRNSNRYALTFDDGPVEGGTDRILDVLGEMNVKAAFFVIGRNVRVRPDLVVRMDREGHLVGNHTYDHWRMASMRLRRYWDRQVRQTDEAIQELIGRRPAMFRPPLGVKSPYINGAAARANQAMVMWTRRAIDGVPATTPEKILRRLVPHTRGGDVLLLHDGAEPGFSRDPSATVACLRPLVEQLREKGLEPVRLDELLQLPGYSTSNPS
jgi:peptidoglycan/xylan/chitin deacetylase (PgdA/CDA1 family)